MTEQLGPLKLNFLPIIRWKRAPAPAEKAIGYSTLGSCHLTAGNHVIDSTYGDVKITFTDIVRLSETPRQL